MSQRFRTQDATGVIIEDFTMGKLLMKATTTPTNSQSGFAVGCLWINLTGTVGTILYINTGSNTSSTWLNIA